MRLVVAVVGIAVAACVPASEKRPPAGAAGFTLEPSAAARGAPFSDGAWTITIERLVVRVRVSASTEGEDYLIDASKPCEIFASGMPVGETTAHTYISGRYVNRGKPDDQGITILGVDDPAIVRTFENPTPPTMPDAFGYQSSSFYQGPSMLLVARGERAGAAPVVLEVAFRTTVYFASSCFFKPSSDKPRETTLVVRENDLVLATVDVLPSPIFDVKLPFDAVVAADANHDGHVDESELAAATLATKTPTSTDCRESLLTTLGNRIGASVFTPR